MEFVVSSGLFNDVIVDYLSIKELINIYYAEYISLENLYNIFINKILVKLNNIFNKDYQTVLNLLKNNKISITGSFILGCIIDKDYYTDIDFCCNMNLRDKCEEFLNFVDASNLSKVKDYPTHFNIKSNLDEKIITEVLKSCYIYNQIFTSRRVSRSCNCIPMSELCEEEDSCYNESKELQFILIDKEDHFDYMNTFDVSICKNLFYIEGGKFKLYIDDLNGIYDDTMKINLLNTSYDRIRKYLDRGFKIIGDNYEEILKLLSMERFSIYKIDDLFYSIDLNEFNNIEGKEIKCKYPSDYDKMECFEMCYIRRFFYNDIKHEHIIPKQVVRGLQEPTKEGMTNGKLYKFSNIVLL